MYSIVSQYFYRLYSMESCNKITVVVPCAVQYIHVILYRVECMSSKLKSLLMRVTEESEKAGLKLSIQKIKIMASRPITSWQIEEEKLETVLL